MIAASAAAMAIFRVIFKIRISYIQFIRLFKKNSFVITQNVMLVVIFGAVSSVQQNGIANNNSQVKQQDLELSEAQYYQVPSRGGRYDVGYGPSSKL